MDWRLNAFHRLCIFIFLAVAACAQPAPNPAERFNNVKGWKGEYHFQEHGTAVNRMGSGVATTTGDVDFGGTAIMEHWNEAQHRWEGTMQVKSHHSWVTVTKHAGGCTSTLSTQGDVTFTAKFQLGTEAYGRNNKYSFGTFDPPVVEHQVTLVEVCPHKATTRQTMMTPTQGMPGGIGPYAEWPAEGWTLSGEMTWGVRGGNPPGSATWKWEPTALLEMVIEPDEKVYDTWRPRADKFDSVPGDKIEVKATLQWSDGTAVDQDRIKVKNIGFDLVNVSHEPGLALNFPIVGAKNAADFQFVPDFNPTLEISGDERQHAKTKEGQNPIKAAVQVSSFDWGAWGEIEALATLKDGPPVHGHLRGEDTQQRLRLPKRGARSLIADGWKKDNNIDADVADDDDSESAPEGLPGCNGDGFTLYEEYRGFYENDEHIEGNPHKKDFFIHNLIGAQAEPGIWLFTEITGFEVHKDLTDNEFYFVDRVINKNHAWAPHRVDQHGVYLISNSATDGAAANFTKAGVHGRPYLTTGISVQDSTDTSKTLGHQHRMNAADFSIYYDYAIAHELLHTVGTEHHGKGDDVLSVTLLLANSNGNRLGRPYYKNNATDSEVHLVIEGTDKELVDLMAPIAVPLLDAHWYYVGYYAGVVPVTESQLVDLRKMLRDKIFTNDFQFGVKGGESSGNDKCVMRYSMAEVYKAERRDDLYYLIPRGTEPLGVDLCRSGEGTGVNGPRTPQPRFFSAAPTRGACFFQVCPNDAIPPGPNTIPSGGPPR